MNLKLIDAALAGYESELGEGDMKRLRFFRTLWEVQARCAEKVDAGSYALPDAKALADNAATGSFVLSEAPIEVDPDLLSDTIGELVRAIEASGYYPPSTVDALAEVDWRSAIDAAGAAVLGSDPSRGIAAMHQALAEAGLPADAARLGLHLATLALKPQLEGPAARIMKARRPVCADAPHTLQCPVCGTDPCLAHVGGATSSAGRGRLLVCPCCGAAWEFERVRCARCGTRNQARLHYFNIEGDDAHRIATCDECGGYIRTIFSEDALAPCSYEVEDVVMAKLDAIAADPSFAGGRKPA